MSVRQYIGARYVPLFDGIWDNTKEYQPLTIVQYQNNWYTSRKVVPVGTAITNTEYWVLTGNLNGAIIDLNEQTEAIRTRLAAIENDIDDIDSAIEEINSAIQTINTSISGINTNITSLGTRLTTAEDDIATNEYALKNITEALTFFTFRFGTVTVPANGNLNATATNTSDFPSNYFTLGVLTVATGNIHVVIRGFDVAAKEINLVNLTNVEQTLAPSIIVRCLDKNAIANFF